MLSVSWEEGVLMVFLPFLPLFPFSKHDNSGSLSLRPQREWMEKPLAFAEMPEIDHRVCQSFQGVV